MSDADDEDEELKRLKMVKMSKLLSEKKEKSRTFPKGVITLTDYGFDDFVSKFNLAIVDCWAPWCGPCRMVSPIIESLSKDYDGRVAFGKLNVDENRRVPGQYGIMSIPTLLVFGKGKLLDRIVGALPKEHLKTRIRKYLSSR